MDHLFNCHGEWQVVLSLLADFRLGFALIFQSLKNWLLIS